MNWKTFFTRTGTAIVFAALMLVGLLGSSYLFSVLFLVVQALCIKEYFELVARIRPEHQYAQSLRILVQIVAAISVVLISPFMRCAQNFIVLLAVVPIGILLWQILYADDKRFSQAFTAIGALLYIMLPIMALVCMREKSLLLPLGLVSLIWINDTMAYIVGSFIGKTPFSIISPKKTWEGTGGGALLTVIAAAVFGYYSGFYTMDVWIVLSLCASIAGTIGDLFESKLKRLAGVKDSGSFMPGHGGALDRFDSLLVATPFAFVFTYLFVPALDIHVF